MACARLWSKCRVIDAKLVRCQCWKHSRGVPNTLCCAAPFCTVYMPSNLCGEEHFPTKKKQRARYVVVLAVLFSETQNTNLKWYSHHGIHRCFSHSLFHSLIVSPKFMQLFVTISFPKCWHCVQLFIQSTNWKLNVRQDKAIGIDSLFPIENMLTRYIEKFKAHVLYPSQLEWAQLIWALASSPNTTRPTSELNAGTIYLF